MTFEKEYMGKRWTPKRAREEYRKGNVKYVVATVEDIGRSRVGASKFDYYNIFAVDKGGKWHLVEDDGTLSYLWSGKKRAWYSTAWGGDRLFEIVLEVFGIVSGKDEIPEIVRLFGY